MLAPDDRLPTDQFHKASIPLLAIALLSTVYPDDAEVFWRSIFTLNPGPTLLTAGVEVPDIMWPEQRHATDMVLALEPGDLVATNRARGFEIYPVKHPDNATSSRLVHELS